MRMLSNPRRLLQFLVPLAVLAAVALWPRAIDVETGTVSRGPMTVTIDDDGETRLHHRFVVSAPVGGRVARITLEPGDPVVRGKTIVAELTAEAPGLLDTRSQAEAAAAARIAQGALGRARAEEQRARATFALARADRERERDLSSAGLTPRQALESRDTAVATAEETVNAAVFAVAAAEADLARAQARLLPSRLDGASRKLAVRAPVDGVVLRRFQESETVVAPGGRLVEIGDPSHVQVVADLLTTDAVQVKPGMRVAFEHWGGDQPLGGRVERVEPAAFTKVSALGVEEQRVNVVIDVDDDAAAWTHLGDGFRVEVRIATWEAADVLRVPTGALFRVGDAWAVFVVENGRARRQIVSLGHRTPLLAEVVEGLSDGARVVLHPGGAVTEGARTAVH